MPKPYKKLETYILLGENDTHSTSLDTYAGCPAKAFLLYVCDAYDSFNYCLEAVS